MMARHGRGNRKTIRPAQTAVGALAGLFIVACQPAPAVDVGLLADGAVADHQAPLDAAASDRAATPDGAAVPDHSQPDRLADDGGAHDSVLPTDAGTDAGPPPPYRPDRRGWIELIEYPTRSEAFALIRSGPDVPQPAVLTTQGDCTIYVHPMADLCTPPCNGFCAPGGDCQPIPDFTSAGTITLTGLHEALTFMPSTWGYAPTPQPGLDMFASGASITASAPGDVAPSFTLATTGVAPLVVPTASLTLVDDADTAVTWTPEHDGRIQLSLMVGFHGAPYEALLLCESDDDGALTIPGALIRQLPRPQNANQPHPSSLTRFKRALALASGGPIELFVGSRVDVTWSHP